MRIKLSGITLNIEEIRPALNSSQVIFFLHGFSGSSNDWEFLSSKILEGFGIYAVDLPGHGKSDSPDDVSLYQTSFLVKQLFELFETITKDQILLAGYSMGGRAALQFALNFTEKLKCLILESSTAGIEEDKQRAARIKADEKLARYIETHSIEEFVNYWMNIDLFKSQKKLSKEILTSVKRDKLKNNKTGLSNSLRGFGTGTISVLFNKLKDIYIKTLLISGELDNKFTQINKRMLKLLPNAEHQIIRNTGHNVHLEKPDKFCDVINNYLKKL